MASRFGALRRAALILAVLGALAAGCTYGGDGASGARDPSWPGDGAITAAARGVADSGVEVRVDDALHRLAAAELRLYDDLGPATASSDLSSYISAVARVASLARAGLHAMWAAPRCVAAHAELVAAQTGATVGMPEAVAQLNARIAAVMASSRRIAADRAAVLVAVNAVRQAMAVDASVLASTTDDVVLSLSAIAAWENSLVNAVNSARSGAASSAAVVNGVLAAAAAVAARCSVSAQLIAFNGGGKPSAAGRSTARPLGQPQQLGGALPPPTVHGQPTSALRHVGRPRPPQFPVQARGGPPGGHGTPGAHTPPGLQHRPAPPQHPAHGPPPWSSAGGNGHGHGHGHP